MELSKSQHTIMLRLKTRGPQSVKILSKQLGMTTMGVRQHLNYLESRDYVGQTREAKQTRGRPVHLWKLTDKGHGSFPDTHSSMAVELIDVLRSSLGGAELERIIDSRAEQQLAGYLRDLAGFGEDLQSRIARLAELRSEEGFMAEVRLLPDGWLLIENHCPIYSAANSCRNICDSELRVFQQMFQDNAEVSRTDYLLDGARRCAYKIQRL